ncbi:MAG: hypothetical protein J6U63_01250 [Clostridia bacterium]|nr:hypothetical protein [Clostridia bacterium]
MIANPGYVAEYAPLLILFLILYWAALSAAALIMYALQKQLSPKAIPAILLFPVFLASWMPINLVACFTKAPRWKMIRHGVRKQ